MNALVNECEVLSIIGLLSEQDEQGSAKSKWPTPKWMGADAAWAHSSESQLCEIVGLSGGVKRAQLVDFQPEAGMVQVMATHSRKSVVPLHFSQFERITLCAGAVLAPQLVSRQPHPDPYTIIGPSGKTTRGFTSGCVDLPYGVFLYEPLEYRTAGSVREVTQVRRTFIPRQAIAVFDMRAAAPAVPFLHGVDLHFETKDGEEEESTTIPGQLEPSLGPARDESRPSLRHSMSPSSRPSLAAQQARASKDDQDVPTIPGRLPTTGRDPARSAAIRSANPQFPSLRVAGGQGVRTSTEAPLSARAAIAQSVGQQEQGKTIAPNLEALSLPPHSNEDAGTQPMVLAVQALREPAITNQSELQDRLKHQTRMMVLPLGETLVALDLLDRAQLQTALEEQRLSAREFPLGQLLVRKGLLSSKDLHAALIRKMGYPVVDVLKIEFDRQALSLVSHLLALRLKCVPLMMREARLVVAVADPSRADQAVDELEFVTGLKVLPVMALDGTLEKGIERAYSLEEEARPDDLAEPEAEAPSLKQELLASLEQGSNQGSAEDDRTIEQSDNSLVRLINSMILEAQAQGVSDIHIESQPGRERVKIRFRRDGILKPYLELPHTYRGALLARIKIMCDLDISERRKPQDGKITLGKFVSGSRLELRVATLPTANGLEDVVLRLLSSAKHIALEDVGMSAENLAHVKEMVARPYGMFLCVGPTGSGKTTTLHSALGFINGPDRKILTAEDPIEITQSGLRQVQVNPKIDWTFAKALRAFLRSDPDVIMVGEIRDKDTAQIAVESSLTGHLVLSTLHTNSAPETVSRLLDMGMDHFNFGDSLLGVLAQRLVRRICPHCRTSLPATQEQIDELASDYMASFAHCAGAPSREGLIEQWQERYGVSPDNHTDRDASGRGVLLHHESEGCERCAGTGYKGRAGIHELLRVTRELRHLIQTGARVDDIQRAGLEAGMRTLRQDGIEKVLAGITSLSEIRHSTV